MLERGEAIEARKQFLSCAVNILTILKRVKNYKIERKRELIFKNKLKSSLSGLNSSIHSLEEHLPTEQEGMNIKLLKKRKGETKQESEKSKNIEAQLREIHSKLASLNE